MTVARNDHASVEEIAAVHASRRDVGTQTDRKPGLTENTSVAFRRYCSPPEPTLRRRITDLIFLM